MRRRARVAEPAQRVEFVDHVEIALPVPVRGDERLQPLAVRGHHVVAEHRAGDGGEVAAAQLPFLAPVIAAADTGKDGWLDEDEMRAALGARSGAGEAAKASQPADYFVAVQMSVCSRQRLDALTLDEAARIPELLLHARSMAHERHAPPGYVASFAPHVVLGDGRPVVTARATPLTAADVRRLEAEWCAKARAGTLLK